MLRVIGVIASDQQDFLRFCRDNGIYLGSKIIRNIIDVQSTRGLKFSCLYITEKAILKRPRKEIEKLRSQVVLTCEPIPF